MTGLLDIVGDLAPPQPWAEGENIPWNEPGFSERMLSAHLSQDHDLASRRFEKIDRHVAWIHSDVLAQQSTRILDLTCGPGFYANRLAALGHECVGVDFSPASIRHATDAANASNLPASYIEGDVRKVDPGEDFGLTLLLWGQINVFRREDATSILSRARRCLSPGGQLLLEPLTASHVKSAATNDTSRTWRAAQSGLFSERPHIVLEESFWDEDSQTATTRLFVIDAESGATTRHALSMVAYASNELVEMLRETGFRNVRLAPSLTGTAEDAEPETWVIRADV